MLKKGQVLNNRYQVQNTLGEGGFGAVYKVWDDNLQRFCAIKENLQASDESQKQFKREAIMLASLNHPHLVRVTDYFFISDRGQYLVMDYVEGDNLETILTNNKGPLPSEQSLAWIRQVCDALIYIHTQNPPIIHRDIKPANIRITPHGNAVLVDFGLAKTFDIGAKTTMGARGLTPHFAAPEQYGSGGTDAQSDIYSLGVTLYCMLTYRVPPDSVEIMVGNANPPPPAKVINRNIPDAISDAVQCAMQISRTDRYKSAGDFKTALILLKAPLAPKEEKKSVIEILKPKPIVQIAEPIYEKKLTLSNGMEFMYVPAGKFLMGSDNGWEQEKPQHIVDIPYDYWMARFPITNEQYNVFVKSKWFAKHPVPNWEKKKDHPVVNVTFQDGGAYCNWLNNFLKAELPPRLMLRLPKEAEWEKSARGTDGREYPWGNGFDENKCNTKNSKSNTKSTDLSQIQHGYESQQPQRRKGYTTPVSLYSPRGDSPYGCADMSGNVWEWVADAGKSYVDGHFLHGATFVARGGVWDYGKKYDVRCAFRYTGLDASFDSGDLKDDLGFRLALVPSSSRS